MKRTNNSVHIFVLRAYMLLLGASIVLGLISWVVPHDRDSYNSGSFCKLSHDLHFEYPDGTISLESLPGYVDSTHGNHVTVQGILPKTEDDSYLFVFSREQNLSVSIDGKIMGTYRGADSRAKGGEGVDAWFSVLLNSKDSGKTIRISYQSDGALRYLYPVYVGDKTAILYHLVKEYSVPVFLGVLMIIIGFVILGYSLLHWKQGSAPWLYIGIFMIFAGMWLFFSSDIRQIFFPYIEFAQCMDAMCMIMLQFPLVLYLDEIAERHFHKVCQMMGSIDLVAFCVVMYLLHARRIDVRSLFLPIEALFLAELALGIFMATKIRKNIRPKPVYSNSLIAGLIWLLAGCVYEIGVEEIIHADSHCIGVTAGACVFSLTGILEFRRWVREEKMKERLALIQNEEKNAFLADMSHAIRTPVNTVLGMDMMIIRKSHDRVVSNYAEDIENACQSLLSIMDDILDFTKIGNEEVKLQPIRYQITSLINDCNNMIMMRVLNKGLEFHIENNPMLPDGLYGDEIRIRQIIINLLTNAVKYTQAGIVTLELDYETVAPGTICLKIQVRDTGIGIRKENIPQLFKSYARFDLKKNARIEGTGLGLSITKKLVELMQGKIEVESVYGKGSVFRVLIPQKVIDETPVGDLGQLLEAGFQKEIKAVRWFRAPQAKLLIVDDVQMNLKVMAGLMEPMGCQMDLVLSGEECLACVKKEKYDIIFMDHMMPQMDGEETFRRMKNLPGNRNSDTPVIMLTANAIVGAKEEYLREGFHNYLSKPVREEELRDICMQYLPKNLIIWEEIKEEKKEIPQTQEEKEIKDQEEEKLKQLEQFLDVSSGMSYCMKDASLYLEILEDYLYANREEQMKESYGSKDWKKYRIAVHSLKSTSLTIGAGSLSEAARALETAAKEEKFTYIEEHHAEVVRNYDELLENLRKVLEEGKTGQ